MKQLILPEFPKYEDIIDEVKKASKERGSYYAYDLDDFVYGGAIHFDDDDFITGWVASPRDNIEIKIEIKSHNGVPTKGEYNRCVKQLHKAYTECIINTLYKEVE